MLLASVSCQTVAAQDVDLDSICRQFDMSELVVTGTRTPKFLKDTPIQTRVISSKEMLPTCRTSCSRNFREWSSHMP